jgi:hypothetical protein
MSIVCCSPMKLETHEGTIANPATLSDVALAVGSLTEVGEAFVILNDDEAGPTTYVQAAGTVGEDFIVEYRDGGAGDHWRADQRVSAGKLISLLECYLRRAADWNTWVTWHRVCVEMDREQPSA